MVRVEDALREALPNVELTDAQVIESGWDSRVCEVAHRWIVRVARNDWAAKGYGIEAQLLPRLAPTLPLQIPIPVRVGPGWALTNRIAGAPADAEAGADLGAQLGTFLRALHAFPVSEARALGVTEERRAFDIERFRTLVLPLLARGERRAAAQLLTEHERGGSEPRLTHADLGPEHILVGEGMITGVIDWTDTRIGDPAIDLAWPLHGAPTPFAGAVAETYGVGAALARRALVYHALGPWHEVVHGLRTDSSWIESGLEGVRARLRKATEGAGTMGW
jgi:aminoglycoside phosphotransferase (APT) family kinase protein